jgi:hypothetical protein
MNLKIEKNLNFNIINIFLLKNTLDLDFKNGLLTAHFVTV